MLVANESLLHRKLEKIKLINVVSIYCLECQILQFKKVCHCRVGKTENK